MFPTLNCLKGLLLIAGLCLVSMAQAQTKKITGKVISLEDSKPLAGVSILTKGVAGTQSDSNGEFSITAAEGDVIVFTFTGYARQSVVVGSSNTLSILMKTETSNLNEVVVVGYGTQSRKNITSAISKIDTKVLETAPRANVGSALQGSVSGLRVVNTSGAPGSAPSVVLRGGATISGNPGAPLTVVDGVIRAFNDISADDIASIEVLKDAASTAIYGARANNGVILITTKQGKAGTAQVSYKFTQAYNKSREDYKRLNAKDYITYTRQGNLNSQRTPGDVNNTRGYGLLTDAANLALFDIRRLSDANKDLLSKGWDTVGDPYGGGTIIFKDHGGEIEDILFRNANTQDHFVNVTGGNDKGRYYASFDYYNEDGVIVGSDYKRYSGTISGSYRVKPKLEVTSGATFSTSSQIGTIGGDVNSLYRNLNLWPTMNPWLDSAKTKPNPGGGIADGNPLYWLNKTLRNNEINRITANASAKYDIMKGLDIKVSGNAYLFENTNESFTKATQTYTQLFASPQAFNTNRPAVWSFSRTVQKTFNAVLNYRTTFADMHNLSAMVGAESFGQKAFNSQLSGTGAPTDDIPTVNASTLFTVGSNFTNKSEFKIISHFGRLNYDYDQRYLLTLVYRQDGISSLFKDTRWGFFPGMSAGWNVHEEKFFKNSNISNYISSLKPRISYGVNGNIGNITDFETQGIYSGQGNYNGSLGFLYTDPINRKLRWEKSATTDVGLDLGLLNNRITLIFDYYDRRTSDLITTLPLPDYTGFGGIRTNLGTLQNKGYEVTANASILKQHNGLSLDVGANISFVKNKVLKLPFNGNINNRQGGFQVYDPKKGEVVFVGGTQEGQPLGAIYGYRQVSIFRDDNEIAKIAGNRLDLIAAIGGPNRPITNKITPGDVNWDDLDKNDTIDSRDQVYLGNINPKFTGGFSTSLSYKNFSFFTRFDFALGHTIYNDLVARTLGNYQGTFNYIDLMKQSWSPTNTVTDIPKVYYADQVGAPAGKKNYTRGNNAGQVLNGNNSRFYEKGDYLACREITLSYDFSKGLLSKTKVLSQARVFFNINNLFYVTKFSGPSPEPPVVPGTTAITGIYAGTYPTPKTFAFGAQVSF